MISDNVMKSDFNLLMKPRNKSQLSVTPKKKESEDIISEHSLEHKVTPFFNQGSAQ